MTDVSPVASFQPASSSSVGSCHCRLYRSSHVILSFSSTSTGAAASGLFAAAPGLFEAGPGLLAPDFVLAGEVFGEAEGVVEADEAAALAAANPASSLADALGPPRRATRSFNNAWSWRTCSMTACTAKTHCQGHIHTVIQSFFTRSAHL